MAGRRPISRGTVDGSIVTKKFFVNGVDAEDNPVRKLDTRELPEAIQEMLAAYGANAAGNAQIQGIVKSAQEACDTWDAFVASLHNATWSPGRAAGEAGPSELVLAFERYEQSVPNAERHSRQEIMDRFGDLSPAQKRQLHSDPNLAPHIRAIRVEHAREAEKAARGKPSVLSGLFKPTAVAAE